MIVLDTILFASWRHILAFDVRVGVVAVLTQLLGGDIPEAWGNCHNSEKSGVVVFKLESSTADDRLALGGKPYSKMSAGVTSSTPSSRARLSSRLVNPSRENST